MKRLQATNTFLDKGKIPPQALDCEEAVIGALMVDSRAMVEIGAMLIPEMFYNESNKEIYATIIDLYATGNAVDLMTVSDHLKKKELLEKIGGYYRIIELTQKVASSAHIVFHSRIIIQKFIQRAIIHKSGEMIELAYNDSNDVFELLDDAYRNLNDISEKAIKVQDSLLSELIEGQIRRGIKIYTGEIEAGLPTPIKRLTERTGGWRETELIILAARPGMGKTAFAVACLIKLAKMNIPVAMFSLEMSKEKLTDRMISMEAEVSSDKFNIYGLSEHDLERIEPVKEILKLMPIHIDDDASLTIQQFQVKAKRLVSKFGVKMIVIDYLQLMSSVVKSGNREQEISSISRGLKITAKELKIPILALAQLSRAVETRGGSKRPMLSDLRESGAIEQDADIVQFLYRPEYYGIDDWGDDYNHESTANECEYIVAKNRNGGLVRNRMKFIGKYTKFEDVDSQKPQHSIPNEWTESSVDNDDDDTPF